MRISNDQIHNDNKKTSTGQREFYDYLADRLSENDVDTEAIIDLLADFQVGIPSWVFDADHKIKEMLEDLIKSIEAIQITYVETMIVKCDELKVVRNTNYLNSAPRSCCKMPILQSYVRFFVKSEYVAVHL